MTPAPGKRRRAGAGSRVTASIEEALQLDRGTTNETREFAHGIGLVLETEEVAAHDNGPSVCWTTEARL